MNALAVLSLFDLAITVLIVLRFARRELMLRTVRLRTLWIRPAIMLVLAAYVVALSAKLDPFGDVEMVGALLVGAVLGVITGLSIVRYTQFAPATMPQAVVVRGNRITFAIWIGALGIRVLARYAVPHGGDPRAQLPLNCGTIVLTATAFVVIAFAFALAIRRYSALGAVPVSITPGSTTRQ